MVFLLRRSVCCAFLAIFVAAMASACASGDHIVVERGTDKRKLGETLTTWGFAWLPDSSSIRIQQHSIRIAGLQAARNFVQAVEGVQYRITISEIEGEKPIASVSEVLTLGKVTDTVVVSIDKLPVPALNGAFVVVQMETHIAPNVTLTGLQYLEDRLSHRCVVPVPLSTTAGPRLASLRAIEALILEKYADRVGTFEGTAFILRNTPRIAMSTENPLPTEWELGREPKVPTGDRFDDTTTHLVSVAGPKQVVFDLEIIAIENLTMRHNATFTSLDDIFNPKKPNALPDPE